MIKYRALSLTSIISVFIFLMSLQSAQAGMVGTLNLQPETLSQKNMVQIRQLVQHELIELGVDSLQAEKRASSLTDRQLSELSEKLGELPAGADLGGTLFTVFILFVITDIIGATDIFPFINPIK